MAFRFGEGKGEAMPFKKFESADEVEEKKRVRQEEWEKVRRPDQPLTAPEENYDPRSLYEQLEAHKQKAQDDFDDKHRLSNQVKGLDDEEAAFLDYVSDRKQELASQRQQEEDEALNEYRKAVASGSSEEILKSQIEKKPAKASAAMKSGPKKSQLDLLKGAVKRKGSNKEEATESKKSKVTGPESDNSKSNGQTDVVHESHEDNAQKNVASETIRVAGILPGLCQYTDYTSDSNSSSSDSDDLTDDTKVIPKPQKCQQSQS